MMTLKTARSVCLQRTSTKFYPFSLTNISWLRGTRPTPSRLAPTPTLQALRQNSGRTYVQLGNSSVALKKWASIL